MKKWKILDLRKSDMFLAAERLIALRLVPKASTSSRKKPYRREEWYEIGYLKPNEYNKEAKKLWLHCSSGTHDPAQLKKRYDIWWCDVTPFDADE